MRGMIDEHLQAAARERVLRTAVRDVRVLLAVIGGVMLVALQVVELVYTLKGGR